MFLFERITVIGLGLIGSSLVQAIHKRQLTSSLIGCDSNEISLAFVRKKGLVDTAMHNAGAAVKGSNLVIIATPPKTLSEIAAAIAPNLLPGAIVMDVCSVKQPAIAAIAPHLPDNVSFMPAHPIAGSEKSGVSAGRADLFEKKRVVVTPQDPMRDDLLQTVTSFWTSIGARIEAMPPHLHDMIYAYVSHLPQLLAFAAAQPTSPYIELVESDEALRKFLRLSRSPVSMWAEIFLLNRDNVLKALDRYLDAAIHIHKELAQATESAGAPDDRLARAVLFPRIASACLITTVMEAEKKAGFPFARYAGPGFTDFTFPAGHPPEEDIERISAQYGQVASVLSIYIQKLKDMRQSIAAGEPIQNVIKN